MTPSYLNEKLIDACKKNNIEDVSYWIDAGADVNFNIKRPLNALSIAIENDNHKIIDILLDNGVTVKEFVLQKAIEKDKKYLYSLLPNVSSCKDEGQLLGILQAAINLDDVELAQLAINQGAKVKKLFIYSIKNLESVEILELLIKNDFNIHADNNMIIREWMGSSEITGWENWKSSKDLLLNFIFEYYLDKPESLEKFKTLRLPDKSRLFRIGLDRNNFNMMKFAFIIGDNKNKALNSALYRYYAKNHNNSSSTHSTMFKNNNSNEIDYDIIEYILSSDIQYDKITISNAVCFKYMELLKVLYTIDDLEYAYEMAYKYEDNDLCEYFIKKGVTFQVQISSKMRVSAIKGDIVGLRKAINDGADIYTLDKNTIEEIIKENKVDSLKLLYDAGLILDSSINEFLNIAISQYKSYACISFLIEHGFDVLRIKKLPQEYIKRYPLMAYMWDKRISDIFDFTLYLVSEVYPYQELDEKEKTLKTIAELSSLPYVIKKSEERKKSS